MTQHRLLPLTALKPWPRNPRRIRPERLEQLKRSLAADPAMMDARPLVALPDGTVIMGNQRLAAAKALGWKKIQTLTVDLDDATAQSWALRDNQGYGEWDADAVGLMLAEMRAAGADLDLAGFEERETQRLLDAITLVPPGVDDAPALPKGKPRSKPGEVYELGEHRLLCGDATSPEAYLTLMAGELAEVMWTDPPYGVEYVGKTKDALTIKNDGHGGLEALLRAAFLASDAVLAPSARIYCAAPPGPHNAVFRGSIASAGWRFHLGLVWVKDRMVLGHSDYHVQHEDILYSWKPGPGRAGRGNHEGTRWYGDHAQTTVFEIDRPSRSSEHPTMKPVELVAACLRNSSRTDDLILDPFAGSGTTLIAAHTLGRRAALIELDPGYCDVIRARYEALA